MLSSRRGTKRPPNRERSCSRRSSPARRQRIDGRPNPLGSLAFVDSIELEGVTANGADEEDEDEYLGRLTEQLQLLSLSLIEPKDFEIDARSQPSVARALCIPGYDADLDEEDVPCCVGEFVIDGQAWRRCSPARSAAGAPRSEGAERCESHRRRRRPPPRSTSSSQLPSFPGTTRKRRPRRRRRSPPTSTRRTPASRSAAATPATSAGWVRQDAVYRNELIAVADRVAGVDRVVTLKLEKAGSPPKTQESVALAGVATLTKPGDIEVSVA